MSRRSVPNIQPPDLRDVASEERVDRIWGRLEQDLATVRARPKASPSRTIVWAAAATFAAFGVGLASGRVLWKDGQVSPSAAVATHDRATVDIFAAGTQERTYTLPGGGTLTLQPGSMIELERAGGSDLRLRLLSGEASIDTAPAGRGALAIVSGEATIATAPGSLIAVQKREDNLDVRVASGSAQVSSPAGTRALRKGEQMDGVPTRVTTAAVTPPVVRVTTPTHTARVARNDAPVAQVAVAPSWREHYQAGRFDEALELLKQQPGGIAGAVASAKGADELMAIGDVARSKGGDATSAIRALHRVADEHGATAYGSIAARQLSKYYETTGQADLAKKYLEQAAQKGVLSEDAMCAMLADHKAANKDEASARATEYLGRYPNGRCKDDANRILEGGDADGDGEPSDAATPPASTAPAAPGAPAPSASAPSTAKPAPPQ